jgi:hypothetical protein
VRMEGFGVELEALSFPGRMVEDAHVIVTGVDRQPRESDLRVCCLQFSTFASSLWVRVWVRVRVLRG